MLRAYLIQVFKILHSIDHVDKDKFFFTFAVDNMDRRDAITIQPALCAIVHRAVKIEI